MPSAESASVLILSSTPGRGSGAERVLEYLLQVTEVRAHVASIIAPRNSSIFEIASTLGVSVQDWPITGDSFFEGLRAIPRLLRDYRPPENVRRLHSWHTRGFETACLLGRRWNLSPSGTLHDHPTQRHSVIRQKIIRAAGCRLDQLAVVSDALATACHEAHWKIPITTIKNGLPDAPVPLSTVGKGFRIGFVGLNARWKGLELLASVVARTSDLPLHWRLFGEPVPDTKPLLSQLLAGSNGRVVHVGYRSPAEIFQDIDLLFHPSLCFDPFPTALLEAARAGVPAIASDAGGSREIVQDRLMGALFPVGDSGAAEAALRRLLDYPERLADLGRNARARFEQVFSIERMAREYIHFWR